MVGSTGSGSGSDPSPQRGDFEKSYSREISEETVTDSPLVIAAQTKGEALLNET